MLVTKRKYPDRSLFVQNVTQIINEFKQNYDVFMTHKGAFIFDVMQIWPILVYYNSAGSKAIKVFVDLKPRFSLLSR